MNFGIQDIFQFQITIEDAIAAIISAFVCGLIISWFYRMTYKGAGYPVTYLYSLVTLTMVTALVIMVIGNNLARAFGLVGAMSIIRFRTAVKDSQDIMFIFFALAIGMTCGVGKYAIALISVMLIGGLLLLLARTTLFLSNGKSYLLQFNLEISNRGDIKNIENILSKYCRKYKMINIRSLGESQNEYAYNLHLKRSSSGSELINSLSDISGVSEINFYFEEENLYNTL